MTVNLNVIYSCGVKPVHYLGLTVIVSGRGHKLIEDVPKVFGERII
jgi:hypothetical protein